MRVIVLGAILALYHLSSSATGYESFIAPNSAVPISYFGIHNHRFHDPRERPVTLFGVWRLWDAGVGWSQVQPGKEQWDFRRLDQAVFVAKQQNLAVHMIFGRTPRWAAANPNASSFYGPGESSPPRSLSEFAEFVRTVTKRYAGHMDSYEVWNEPASSGMFAGSVQQMVEMTQLVAKEVRTFDPAAKVVCPSPAKHESLNWFRQFVQAGGTQHCDIIGYHFYTDSHLPEDRLKLIAAVRGILQDNGISGKPIWDTESGTSVRTTKNVEGPGANGSAHLARWLILTWASGIERFYWYSWDHDRLGFKMPGREPNTDAVKVFKKVQSWMLGAQFHSCRREHVLWTCDLTLVDGRAAHIRWTSDNSTIPASIVPSSLIDGLFTELRQHMSDRILINGDPQLIVQAAVASPVNVDMLPTN